MTLQNPLVVVRDLTKSFPIHGGIFLKREVGSVRAVDRVNLAIGRGETLALVGESGCGKSTTGRLIMRLIEPTSGSVQFDEIDIMSLGRSQLRLARQRLQLMFQDPSSAFNPRMNVEQIISEPMLLAGSSKSERRDRVRELLPLVGLAEYQAARFPHQFSGGQRQRIGIARALSLRPDFIVCDEPVSALDVSVQAQVINLLSDLQQQFGLTYLFISHDLRVVRHIADRIGVMYQGRIVELADKNSLYSAPQHPYTRMLLSSVPRAIPNAIKRPILVREKADSINRLSHQGCNFADRCTQVMTICRTEAPALKTTFGENSVACHLQNAANGGT